MNIKVILLSSIIILGGCKSTTFDTPPKVGMTAIDAIELSEEAAPKSARGIFFLSIKASGSQKQYVYLNTEQDYRDRRNVSVVLLPEFQKAFIKKYGVSPDKVLVDKSITVNSFAKRIKIYFFEDGKPTDKYYFQTHIPVKHLKQLKFCEKCIKG